MKANNLGDIHSVEHVKELDGLRGLLALWVALAHIFLWCGFAEPPIGGIAGRILETVIKSDAAVQAFFILSGFAISHLLYSRKPAFGRFMLGRFFRIYPIYFTCLLLGLLSVPITPYILETAPWRETSYFGAIESLSQSEREAPLQHLGMHLTLLHGVLPKQVLPNSAATLLVPAWSISVEWQYYLCALLIAAFARSAIGLVGMAVVSWVAIRYGYHWINPLKGFMPLVLPFFLVGIGSYHLFRAFVASGGRRSAQYIALVGAAIAAVFLTRWNMIAMAIWVVSLGCLFVEPIGLVGRPLGWYRVLLAHPIIQFLGRLSYPLYLVHWPLIAFFLALLLYIEPNASFAVALTLLLTLGLPLMLLSAYILHVTIEAPCMRIGKRLARGSHPAMPAGAMSAAPLIVEGEPKGAGKVA